jgi:uncharacterized glyoxalase superfamily protein PhnB
MTRTDRNIWPLFLYDDALAARAWLAALGFEEGLLVPGATDGSVQHSEMLWPEGGRVMVASREVVDGEHHSVGSCYVVTSDPDAVHRRALELGATVTREPVDTDYGSRDVGLADPEGNTWHFGTYAGDDTA